MLPRCLFVAPLCAGFVFASANVPASAQADRDPTGIVWCHDVERSLVTRKQAWRCNGRVVDDKEAEKIRLRRIRRIQGRIKKPKPLFKDTRLNGSGTGFFVSADGDIVTNHHVVNTCTGISFTPAGSQALVTELIATDEAKDLALLRAPMVTQAFARFRDPGNVRKDEDVAVIGYPLHGRVAIRPVIVMGQVFEPQLNPRPGRFPMRIDVRRGNSGGPVLDRSGLVVGVVVAKVNTPHVFATTGKLIRNVGISIRSHVALGFLRQHRVQIATERGGAPADGFDLYRHANFFIGQVGCWR